MKCFEVNLLLQDHEAKVFKDLRQYFHQEKGPSQAIKDMFKWSHREIERCRSKHPTIVAEKLILWSWEVATPDIKTGEIKTHKSHRKIFNWSFERGIIEVLKSLPYKEKKHFRNAARYLNKYRHIKAEILIEEVLGSIADGVKCIAI